MFFIIDDDSLVHTGTEYQIDNLEIYFDMDNSKNIKWPRNGGWMADDPTYDDNDYQLRLVPDSTWLNDHPIAGSNLEFSINPGGYAFILNIAWDSLMNNFEATEGTLIGFDVLASDNDAVASDANRNQVTLNSPTTSPYNDPSLFATFELKDQGTFLLIPDEEEPAAVTNFAGTGTEEGVITLTWDPATDNIAIMTYIIIQGSNALDTIYGKETGNSYTVPGNFDAGNWIFKIMVTDNYGNESDVVQATVNVPEPVEPENIENEITNEFSIYPNPATSELRISGVDVEYVELFNISGNLVNFFNKSVINISDIENGVYKLRVYTESDIYTTRLIKK